MSVQSGCSGNTTCNLIQQTKSKSRLKHWNWMLYKVRGLFMHKTREWSTWLKPRAFHGQAQISHAVCTLQVHPPTFPSHTLPAHTHQNLSPKDIAGYDIMKLKASRCTYAHWLVKQTYLYPTERQVPKSEVCLISNSIYLIGKNKNTSFAGNGRLSGRRLFSS